MIINNFNSVKMKNLIQKTILSGVMLLLIVSCKTTSTASFYSYETECLGVEMDGVQTLKTVGKGKLRADAVRQAQKNALRDVIFKGNLKGSGDCAGKPLLLEVNAQEKYESYFNAFFKDGGDYENFVSLYENFMSLKGEKITTTILRGADSRNKDLSVYSVVVRVLRTELKEKLIKDGILKQ
jgi:hypothetical protein